MQIHGGRPRYLSSPHLCIVTRRSKRAFLLSWNLVIIPYMAQKFKLVERKNLGKDNTENPKKFYAQAVNNGYVPFTELCADIAEGCTLTSADVKAVLDRMNFMLDKHLKAGRIVQFGEIGNFRLALGSSGSLSTKGFNTSQIKKPRIVFHPGDKLQETRTLATFEHVGDSGAENRGNQDSESPGEI